MVETASIDSFFEDCCCEESREVEHSVQSTGTGYSLKMEAVQDVCMLTGVTGEEVSEQAQAEGV